MRFAGCPKLSGEEAGGGGDPRTFHHSSSAKCMRTLWFLPASSGTNLPLPTLHSSDKADKRGQGGSSSCHPGSTTLGSPSANLGKRLGVLNWPFQLPSDGQDWGVPWNLQTYLWPHHFFILIFFPRRKQLSRVYKHWEMCVCVWGGALPAPDRAKETDQKPGRRREGREKMSL